MKPIDISKVPYNSTDHGLMGIAAALVITSIILAIFAMDGESSLFVWSACAFVMACVSLVGIQVRHEGVALAEKKAAQKALIENK